MIMGEKTRLRAVERSDIPAFVRWFNDPDVRQYLNMYLPLSEAEEEQWFERHLQDDSGHVFAMETAEGVHIGNIGLHDIDWKNRKSVCGIVIGEKDYWGRGYGADALRTLLRFGFGELNLHRVSLHVFDFNERAIRCYEKIGFRHEGRLRQTLFTGGRYADELVMAVLRQEWEEDQK